jgi:hypothetical protein
LSSWSGIISADEIGDGLAGVGFHHQQVVGHVVGVFEDDLEGFAGLDDQARGVVAHLLADGGDDEDVDAQLF